MGGKVSLWSRDGFCSGLSSQQDGPAQQRVPLWALKVSPGTFQFNLPSSCFAMRLGEFSHFSCFFWPFSCCFLAIVLQKKKLIPSSGPLCSLYFSAEVAVCAKAVHFNFFPQKSILLIYGSFFVHIIQQISTEIILARWLTTTLPAVASEAILVFDAMLKKQPRPFDFLSRNLSYFFLCSEGFFLNFALVFLKRLSCSMSSWLSLFHCTVKAECTFWLLHLYISWSLMYIWVVCHGITQCKQSRNPEIVTSVFSPFEYFVIFLKYLWT